MTDGEKKPLRLSRIRQEVLTGERGIECPSCHCRHFRTTHTEPRPDGSIQRRKECRNCGRKIKTYELSNHDLCEKRLE